MFHGQDQGVMRSSLSSSAHLGCFLGTLLHSRERWVLGMGGQRQSWFGGDRETGSRGGGLSQEHACPLGWGWAAGSRGHEGEEDRWFPHGRCYAEGQVWGWSTWQWLESGRGPEAGTEVWDPGGRSQRRQPGRRALSKHTLFMKGCLGLVQGVMVPRPLAIPPASRGPPTGAVHSWL